MLSTIAEVTHDIDHLNLDAFEFDWTRKSSDNSLVYSATIEKELAGLVEFEPDERSFYNFMYLIEVIPEYRGTSIAGELLAFIGLNSIERGFDGFVVFESKTVYYEYYIDRYGAKPLRGRRLYFDTEATKRLIRLYIEVNYTSEDILKPPLVISDNKEEYVITPEEKARSEKIIAEGDAYVMEHGHGIVPPKNRNDLTGFRHLLAIEARIGRKITESEWENMSIR